MKNWKLRLIIGFFSLITIFIYITFFYSISTGKRVGNLTKLSLKGRILKTWEGTLSEGYGDKLTTQFSISDEKLAHELYEHEGREVVIFYEEHLSGWPRDTHYNVIKWHPMVKDETSKNNMDNKLQNQSQSALEALKIVSHEMQLGLFCSLLGTLVTDQELYKKVKTKVQEQNPYLFEKMKLCNYPSINPTQLPASVPTP